MISENTYSAKLDSCRKVNLVERRDYDIEGKGLPGHGWIQCYGMSGEDRLAITICRTFLCSIYNFQISTRDRKDEVSKQCLNILS